MNFYFFRTAKTPDIRAKLTARPETVNNHSRNVLLSKESTRTKEDFKKFSPWMKTREAGGDNTINLQNRPVKKHLINEPIARSIAGYVNNVQGNLTSVSKCDSTSVLFFILETVSLI